MLKIPKRGLIETLPQATSNDRVEFSFYWIDALICIIFLCKTLANYDDIGR